MRPLVIGLAALLAAPAAAEDRPVLTIYTYDSFVTDWGPGPMIEPRFEEICGCDLQLVAAGDGAALLSRLRLEGARTDADIVLGLDTSLTADGADLVLPHGLSPAVEVPVEWSDPNFVPYDWGAFAFVYDTTKVEAAPTSFEELMASDLSIVIQDPRSSTPGLGLLMWVKHVYGDDAAEAWARLAPRIVTVTAGWSEAYGLFLEGEADMVLSYTTSPTYHLIAEEDDSKAAAVFEEGHYLQIEVAGIVKETDQPELARAFLEFMVTEGFQAAIPTTNWMFPAVTPAAGLPEGFAEPLDPADARLFAPEEAQALRETALDEWLAALSR
ncbi:MAG: thiamine ABC transporter substrate binding subunit [Pseudomonadota bacterium]